eukprot:g1559.t1
MDQQLLDPSRHGGIDDGGNDDGGNGDGGNSDGGNSDVGSVENGLGYGTTVRHRREFSPTWKEAMDPRTSIPENSIKNTVFTLVSTIIGGGVLSLPWTFAVAGIGVGSAILLAISLLSAYSGNLLIACAVHSGGRSYEEIARLTFGAKMASFVNVQIFFLVYFACIGYVVLMTDIMSSMVPPLLDCKCTGTVAEYEHCQRMSQWILTGLIVALAFPLSLLRKLTALRFTSMLSVVSITFLASVLCYKSLDDNFWNPSGGGGGGNSSSTPDDRRAMMRMNDACMAKHPHSRLDCLVWYRFSMRDFPLTLPVLSASFMMHFNVLPARAELRKPTAERMRRVIRYTIALAAVLYLIVAVAGYLDWLDLLLSPAGGNILNLYPHDDPVVTVGRVGIVGTLYLSFPLLTHPARSTLEKMACNHFSTHSAFRSFLITLLLALSIFVLSVLVPNILVVWTITGSVCAIVIEFVLPAMFYLKLSSMTRWKRNRSSRIRAWMMLFLGIILTIVCTAASIDNVIQEFSRERHQHQHQQPQGNSTAAGAGCPRKVLT